MSRIDYSFSEKNENETTRHVHRLHPYRGKYIPQLPEYFLKQYFQKGDIILDPFCGSGTTLVQASEMGIHAIGIDVSEFAVFMTNVKTGNYDRKDVANEIKKITEKYPAGKDLHEEIQFIFSEIKKIQNPNTKKFLALTVSRIMNVKSKTHPEIFYWWKKYSIDSLNRMIEYQNLKTDSIQLAISGDSRNIDLLKEIGKRNSVFANLVSRLKIKGVITSPPYVGVIDYHEEHAGSYRLFSFKRNDEFEIGPKFQGEDKNARDIYVSAMIQVFQNIQKYLVENGDLFVVVNDKFNLYPFIIKSSRLKIVEQNKRAVLNRTSNFKTPYSETIFHLQKT